MVQVKDVFAAIASVVGLRVGSAIGQSSIEDERLELIKRPNLGMCSPFDPEDGEMELQTAVDILVATPGRLMDHINMTKGFSLEHLCYLVIQYSLFLGQYFPFLLFYIYSAFPSKSLFLSKLFPKVFNDIFGMCI